MDNFNMGAGISQISRSEVIQMLLRVSIVSVVTFCSIKWMMKQLDPTSKNKRKAKLRAEEQLRRLNENGDFKINTQIFNDYELMIASHLVVPSDIPVTWGDIAGLDAVIEELRESVVYPIKHKDLFSHSSLCQAPKGVLLHGPPGCGKTLIAKATAREAGMRFINLDVSILTDKWYGESQKLASAVFSLASKIQPCIIFIDEIDSFLRSRNSSDHEATAMIKTQFMMLWDGLSTNFSSTVIVMGATNRPQDLDKAILRRMPAQFHIGLPKEAQRIQILKLILRAERLEDNINYEKLAKLTTGFSGSDLREMCRIASVFRMRQFMRSNSSHLMNGGELPAQSGTADTTAAEHNPILKNISMDDLTMSFEKMKHSKVQTASVFVVNRTED